MNKNVLIVSVFVVVVVIVLLVFLFYGVQKQQSVYDIANNKKVFDEFLDLKTELIEVAEKSGEISSERYAEIEKILDDAESQGYSEKKINYLRDILSKLIVEDSKKPLTNESDENLSTTSDVNAQKNNINVQDDDVIKDVIIWKYNGVDWMPSRVPPECPTPIVLQAPVDINLATSVFYPGQVRGGNYKSHGGFRFDDSDNNIEVKASFDGFIWRANRYMQSGEVQYMFDIIYPCGIMYMVDHLRVLPPKLMNVISQLPEPTEDSLPSNIYPLPVTKGEVLATAVGMKNNVFMDFGVYDLRQKNEVIQDPYAICGFDLLPFPDREKIKLLPPSDDDAGKKSDYC